VLQLIAQGPKPRQRWRKTLPTGTPLKLGRGPAADLPVPWENCLASVHATIECDAESVRIRRVDGAPNPIYLRGSEIVSDRLSPGEQFVIGGTRFLLVRVEVDESSPSQEAFEQYTFTRQQLAQVPYRDADRRLEVLSHLPEVISGAGSEPELYSRLTNLLLAGIPHAEAVAVVTRADDAVQLPYWERRHETEGAFRPSRRLVSEALERGRSVLNVWEGSTLARVADYTMSAEFDWAFCTPIDPGGQARWGLYVTGKLEHEIGSGVETPPELQADVKFTELVAAIVESAQRLRRLEGSVSVLRQFLSPPILSTLEQSAQGHALDEEVLAPRECEVTVLFCDLRGFSQRAERSRQDLPGLLDRVSAALEVMTTSILEFGGVTGDFLGDASLGFWGWPFASEEAPLNACRAALAIRRTFVAAASQTQHPLANFEVGIGIAHGRAMAGKIGTGDRMTVTVFGPVVNLAARLETMTKRVHVPILLDEATAAIVRERLSDSEARVRKLAKVLPYGIETPLVISELLPSVAEYPELTDGHIEQYEAGVDHFIAGRWDQAYHCLHEMPSTDQAQDFLTLRIAQHDRRAPADWDGVIRLPGK
jgi:adenylate cyclase